MTQQQQQKASVSNTILVANILIEILKEVQDTSATTLREQLLEYQRNIITTVPPPTQQWLNKQLGHFSSALLFKNLVLLAVRLNDRGQQEVARLALKFLERLGVYRILNKKIRVGKYCHLIDIFLDELDNDYKNLPTRFIYLEDSNKLTLNLSTPLNQSQHDGNLESAISSAPVPDSTPA